MKDLINNWIDAFEDKFNHIIDLVALVGSLVAIASSVFIFFAILLDGQIPFLFELIIPPGVIGFFSILMLFALRLVRRIARKDKYDQGNL